jgi:hypothetical protein
MAVSKESLIYSYIFNFTLLMVVMTNSCQYFAFHRPQKPDCWGRWGPTVLMMLATVLLLVAPLKNLVVNVCMQSFRENGFDSTIEHALDFAYLPVFGEKHMRFYTSAAYMLMLWGTAMQVDAFGKFESLVSSQKAKMGFKGINSKAECGPSG